MAHLKVEKLEKSYGTNKILKGISFEVQSGEFVSLLGPSGCGKTTTLRCIAGLERPDTSSGTIKVDQITFSDGKTFLEPEERQCGMVFQNYAVWPHMNVFENVAFPLRIRRKLTRVELEEKVYSSLEAVHLKGLAHRYPHELSGGQQQRVALGRALAMSPRLLLLDEPLSNLDVLLRDELRGELKRITKQLKLTTVLVTHDQKEALSLSDRVIVLNGGAIEAQGQPETLFGAPPTDFAAEFLAQAQIINGKSGRHVYLPRKWSISPSGTQRREMFKVVARLYLGNEFEYLVESPDYDEPIRFFAKDRLQTGSQVGLNYDGGS